MVEANEWYTFVKNAKTSEEETVQDLGLYSENETNSSDLTELGNHSTNNDVNGEIEMFSTEIKVDKEWNNTFDTNDKKSKSEKEEMSVAQAKKRPYHCSICQKTFQNSTNLKSHEMIHTGEVPYGCNTCMKRFNQKGALKIHERIHTGEMPYECNKCNKTFNRKDNLKIHERMHTGEEPYRHRQENAKFLFKFTV